MRSKIFRSDYFFAITGSGIYDKGDLYSKTDTRLDLRRIKTVGVNETTIKKII